MQAWEAGGIGVWIFLGSVQSKQAEKINVLERFDLKPIYLKEKYKIRK
jgi:hypothetical protein